MKTWKASPLLVFDQTEPNHREVPIFASDSWLWLFDLQTKAVFVFQKIGKNPACFLTLSLADI